MIEINNEFVYLSKFNLYCFKVLATLYILGILYFFPEASKVWKHIFTSLDSTSKELEDAGVVQKKCEMNGNYLTFHGRQAFYSINTESITYFVYNIVQCRMENLLLQLFEHTFFYIKQL